MPEATVEALNACANQAAVRLTDSSYAIMFDVEVSGSGEARAAKLKGSSPQKEKPMDEKIAEKLLAISMDCTRDTSESVKQVKEKCDEETFKIYRGYGGRIIGNLFTEILAPIQSEHPELAPPDFKAMQRVERPRLRLTKENQDELLTFLDRLYERIETMADFVRDNCDEVEAATYRGRINEVLVHVAETKACALAAYVEEK